MSTFDATRAAGQSIAYVTIETLNASTRAWEVVERETAINLTADDLDLGKAAESIGATPGAVVRMTLRDEDNHVLWAVDSRDFHPDFLY